MQNMAKSMSTPVHHIYSWGQFTHSHYGHECHDSTGLSMISLNCSFLGGRRHLHKARTCIFFFYINSFNYTHWVKIIRTFSTCKCLLASFTLIKGFYSHQQASGRRLGNFTTLCTISIVSGTGTAFKYSLHICANSEPLSLTCLMVDSVPAGFNSWQACALMFLQLFMTKQPIFLSAESDSASRSPINLSL